MDLQTLNHQGCKNTNPLKFRRYYSIGNALIGINCEECLSEWVINDFLPDFLQNNRSSETMDIGGETYHLMMKPRVDEPNFSIQPHFVEVKDLDNLAEHLHPGDHIKYLWYLRFDHHAIVTEVRQNANDPDEVTLIHYQGTDNDKGMVKKETISNMRGLKIDKIYRCDYNDGSVCEDEKILTVARAVSWIGEIGYNILGNNCEHFAVFCKIGRHWSFQVERLVKRVCTAVNEVAIQTSKGMLVDAMGDLVEFEVVVDRVKDIDALAPQTQLIGVGIVVVVQGISLFFYLKKLRESRESDEMTEEEYTGMYWRRVCKMLDKVFFTGIVPAGIVSLGALLPGGKIVMGVSMLLGVFASGTLSIPWGYNGEFSLGCHIVSELVRWIIPYEETSVQDISNLSTGDHIVMLKWFLHPRCHMIVTRVDKKNGKVDVIRFTYRRGVIEECINFHTPMYKVRPEDSFPPATVVSRARGNNAREYNILTYNCKHFAFWCKTDRIPPSP